MSLNTGVIQDNQVAGRGFLGTTVNSEDATKNFSHIHDFHIDPNAPCFCITMVMKTWEVVMVVVVDEGWGGWVNLKMVNRNFFFHLSLSNCRVRFCLSNEDLTIKANYSFQALST